MIKALLRFFRASVDYWSIPSTRWSTRATRPLEPAHPNGIYVIIHRSHFLFYKKTDKEIRAFTYGSTKVPTVWELMSVSSVEALRSVIATGPKTWYFSNEVEMVETSGSLPPDLRLAIARHFI